MIANILRQGFGVEVEFVTIRTFCKPILVH